MEFEAKKDETILPFTEKEINNKVVSKVQPVFPGKKQKHPKGDIYYNGILMTRVKLPNPHPNKSMNESKSKYIANALLLKHSQFNKLIKCTMKGGEYYKIISKYK